MRGQLVRDAVANGAIGGRHCSLRKANDVGAAAQLSAAKRVTRDKEAARNAG
jgi:hypothetical protein